NWTNDSIYLAFETDRELTVYVASDPAVPPSWLSGRFAKTGMTVGTTAGKFEVWERSFAARDFVILPGNGAGADDYNYWVILSETPDAITESPDYFLAAPGADWNTGRYHWQITTNPTGSLHTASLATAVMNFQAENGFKIATNFRVPQLQHDGENSFGLVLLGDLLFGENGFSLDPARGIRAEWLPRQADGTSVLRLIDQATGSAIFGSGASAVWEGETPTRTSDW